MNFSTITIPVARLFSNILFSINSLLAHSETKSGLLATSALVAVILVAIGFVYSTPGFRPVLNGYTYSQLALDAIPSEINGPQGFRVLSILAGSLLGLKGPAFSIIPGVMGLMFVGAVYFHYRKTSFTELEAAGMAALIAFSTPILYGYHFVGYTDTTSYLFVFLSIIFIRSRIWPLFFAMAMLNHESNLFAAPFICLLSYKLNGGRISIVWTAVGLGLALLPTIAYRLYILNTAEINYSPGFLLNYDHIHWAITSQILLGPLGAFYGYKLFWVLPLVALCKFWTSKRYLDCLIISSMVLFTITQLGLGTDTTRYFGLMFPAILFATAGLREYYGRETFIKRLWILIGLNFLIPQLIVQEPSIIPVFPFPVSIIMYFFGIDVWQEFWI